MPVLLGAQMARLIRGFGGFPLELPGVCPSNASFSDLS